MSEDKIVDALIRVFVEAVQLPRNWGFDGEIEMDVEAMDLLMDHALSLEAEGLASVLVMLTTELSPATREQAAAAVNCWFAAERLLGSTNPAN
jgi:hypothetical protein